jgi:hypothetical protein
MADGLRRRLIRSLLEWHKRFRNQDLHMALSDISKLTASAGFTERNDPFNLFGEWLK